MPRIFDSANSPHDFCLRCLPNGPDAAERFGDVGNGPDGRGNCFEYYADHPNYDGDQYTCERCKTMLTDRDN